jgi:hypothetical protein
MYYLYRWKMKYLTRITSDISTEHENNAYTYRHLNKYCLHLPYLIDMVLNKFQSNF